MQQIDTMATNNQTIHDRTITARDLFTGRKVAEFEGWHNLRTGKVEPFIVEWSRERDIPPPVEIDPGLTLMDDGSRPHKPRRAKQRLIQNREQAYLLCAIILLFIAVLLQSFLSWLRWQVTP